MGDPFDCSLIFWRLGRTGELLHRSFKLTIVFGGLVLVVWGFLNASWYVVLASFLHSLAGGADYVRGPVCGCVHHLCVWSSGIFAWYSCSVNRDWIVMVMSEYRRIQKNYGVGGANRSPEVGFCGLPHDRAVIG